ncbi:hypothetical protein CTRI78_v010226 [Colletotrichum trifolii]|uniref:Uncharacterized protein n=1 Tax=Colletotrichum trifolii TaxID=5466 RepID=A0A4R8QQM2_COLTR|nr:hypothetical protein CTRI78_v010226 [Colletotrichum trifolii]
MKFSLNLFFAIATIMSGVSATCVDSYPGSSTYNNGDCRKGLGLDHKCASSTTAYFRCCSNANCT